MSGLADSVASVAESFIHDELDQVEEATLRESFHPDLAASVHSVHNVPGGLDPFLSAPEDENFQGDGDPAGISIFASLIERLLSRFEFDAMDTKITLVHPERASFTLSIQEILYRTERETHTESGVSVNPVSDQSRGQTRTLSISGFNLSLRDLRLPISSSAGPSPTSSKDSSHFRVASPRSLSPASSSSSLDEGTQFLMSQSIVSLPPRSSSPASPESSMYHSAISTLDITGVPDPETQGLPRNQSRTPSPGPHHDTPKVQPLSLKPTRELQDSDSETLLSFGTDPITIRLTTPHVKREQDSLKQQTSVHSPSPSGANPTSPLNLSEKLELNVVTGVIACALRAWHIRSVLDAVESWNSHSQSLSSRDSHKPLQDVQEPSVSILGVGIEGSIQVRGIVLILLPPIPRSPPPGASLHDIYFAHPLVPPQLPHGYVRVHLEVLDLSFSTHSSNPITAAESSVHNRKESSSTMSTVIKLSLSLTELSIFAFHTPAQAPTEDKAKIVASPVLITDYQLPSQYSPHDCDHFQAVSKTESREKQIELPTFELVDWTSDAHHTSSPKLSLWRTKTKAHRSRQRTSSNHPPVPKAIVMEATRTVSITPLKAKKYPSTTIDSATIRTLPLQIFVDVGLALSSDGLISFLEEAIPLDSGDKSIPQTQSIARPDDDEGNTSDEGDVPVVSYAINVSDQETERMRLERLVLEDLNLDLDYRQAQTLPLTSDRASKHKVIVVTEVLVLLIHLCYRVERGRISNNQMYWQYSLWYDFKFVACRHHPRCSVLVLWFSTCTMYGCPMTLLFSYVEASIFRKSLQTTLSWSPLYVSVFSLHHL
jgi:autophagy-related protein 2